MSIYFRENKAQEDHGRKSLRSGVSSVAARGLNIFVQIASTICLARLLSPHEYGLVAMVTAVVGFAPMLIDLGMADALVQKPQVDHAEVSAIFWLNLCIGLILAVALILGSPLLAAFYREPELRNIAIVSSLSFVFTAVSLQHYALLRRAMQFQQIAIIDVTASLFGAAIAVVMAFAGWGYWSLCARPVLTSLFAAIGVFVSCRWIPGAPRFTSGVKDLIRFGMNITGFTLTDYAGRSADRIALGYSYGAKELGYFQNALVLYDNLLSIVTSPLHTVAVTGLSKLRDNIEQLRRSWATALSALSFFAMPAFSILAVTANDVTVLLLGKKWAAAGPLLSVIAIRGIAHVVERTLGWLHVAAGRSDRWLRWGLLSSVVQLIALGCGLPFGLMGVAIAYTIVMFLLFVPAIAYAGKPLGIGTMDVIKTVGPQCGAALLAAAAGFFVRGLLRSDINSIFRCSILALTCCLVYCLLSVGLFRIVKPLRLAHSLMRDYLPTKLLARRKNVVPRSAAVP